MFTNNNFYGILHDKTIKDFTTDLDYSLDNTQDRIKHIKDKLEIVDIDGAEFAHEYFEDIFTQTFDTQLDKEGIYWVEEENMFMNCQEFIKWTKDNDINIEDYLDLHTAFDNIEYKDKSVEKGKWIYSNSNTSNIKLVVNTNDALYTSSNICNELSRLADYILAKEKKEAKVEYRFFTDKELFLKEWEELINLKNNSSVTPFLKDTSYNYKKEKKQKVYAKDIEELNTLSDYNSFLEFMKSKLRRFKSLVDQDKLTDEEKKELSELQRKKYLYIKHVGKVEEDMTMAKNMLKGTIYFKAAMEDNGIPSWDLIDYTNAEHIRLLLRVKSGTDFTRYLPCLVYDLNDAIKRTKLSDKEKDILVEYRYGKNTYEISDELDVSRQYIDDVIKRISVKIAETFKDDYEHWYYLNIEKGIYKTCKKCKEVRLANNKNFRVDSKGKLGLRAICKDCESQTKQKEDSDENTK